MLTANLAFAGLTVFNALMVGLASYIIARRRRIFVRPLDREETLLYAVMLTTIALAWACIHNHIVSAGPGMTMLYRAIDISSSAMVIYAAFLVGTTEGSHRADVNQRAYLAQLFRLLPEDGTYVPLTTLAETMQATTARQRGRLVDALMTGKDTGYIEERIDGDGGSAVTLTPKARWAMLRAVPATIAT